MFSITAVCSVSALNKRFVLLSATDLFLLVQITLLVASLIGWMCVVGNLHNLGGSDESYF